MAIRSNVFAILLMLPVVGGCASNTTRSQAREQGTDSAGEVDAGGESTGGAQPGNDPDAATPAIREDAGEGDASMSAPTGPIRIMPLGDSLTFGTSAGAADLKGGYRIHLLELLSEAGYQIDYVGSARNGPQGFDGDHSAMEGASIAAIQQLWADADPKLAPQVVLLMAGTNDALGVTADQPPEPASVALGALIDRIATDRPDTQIVVSKLIPLVPTFLGLVGQEQAARVPTYNTLVEKIVAQKQADGLKVHLADLSSINGAELGDGIHPSTMATYDQMAELWFPSVVAAIEALGARND